MGSVQRTSGTRMGSKGIVGSSDPWDEGREGKSARDGRE